MLTESWGPLVPGCSTGTGYLSELVPQADLCNHVSDTQPPPQGQYMSQLK